jgi:hypothetical protein
VKKRILSIAIALLLCACNFRLVIGSGRRVTESREVRDFDHVSLTSLGEVILTQGDGESLTIETNANLMQYIISEVRGGRLILGTEAGKLVRPTRLRYMLGVEDLNGLSDSGLGNITAEHLHAGRLDIRVSGSGNVRIDELTAESVDVWITGSGDVELAGEVTDLTVSITDSGNYLGKDLSSETASVTISGSGDATVWTTEFLKVQLTGDGSTSYYGDPAMDIWRSGEGKLVDRGRR